MKTKKHPILYNGYFIKRCSNGNLSAYNFRTDVFLNPLYNTWDQLKLIIDNLK